MLKSITFPERVKSTPGTNVLPLTTHAVISLALIGVSESVICFDEIIPESRVTSLITSLSDAGGITGEPKYNRELGILTLAFVDSPIATSRGIKINGLRAL
jgi:hypothetical protein